MIEKKTSCRRIWPTLYFKTSSVAQWLERRIANYVGPGSLFTYELHVL